MITTYVPVDGRLICDDANGLARSPLWVDLLEPTAEEEALVERALSINVPTREEMQEIETSSRLYREDQAVFVTAPVLANADSRHPQAHALTFILTPGCAITVRYTTPRPVQTFSTRLLRQTGPLVTSDAVLAGLLECVVERLADVLEGIGNELEAMSHTIFHGDPQPDGKGSAGHPDYKAILAAIGRNGDLASKAQESLLGLGRVTAFLGLSAEDLMNKSSRGRLKTMARDIRSLGEHATFLSGKMAFLLDATLGMINIEQNNIIKIFSVVAFVFLPPTLIASIYGMNFQILPELHWDFGYPMALGLMVVSATLPYLFFKKKGWL